MRQTTTPTIRIRSKDVADFRVYDEIRVALYNSSMEENPVIRETDTIEVRQDSLGIKLSQEETSRLGGLCTVEMRVKSGTDVIGFRNNSFLISFAQDKVIM